MSYILCIETATPVCSVALFHHQNLLGCFALTAEKSHAEQLSTLIQNLVKQCGITMEQLSAIAVSKGPGSYTGLRIGVSTAKGLCFALDIPLIAIETLEAMALQVNNYNITHALLCPMIDARRMEVYCALWDKNMNLQMPTEAKIIDETSFEKWLADSPILFFGNGAMKCQPLLQHQKNAYFIAHIVPDARNIGQLAVVAYQEQRFEDVAYFEPYYLKDFVGTKPKKKPSVQ